MSLDIKPERVWRLLIMFIAYMAVIFAFTEYAARWLDRSRWLDLIWLVPLIGMSVLFLHLWGRAERKPTS